MADIFPESIAMMLSPRTTEVVVNMLAGYSGKDAVIILGSQSLEVNYEKPLAKIPLGKISLRLFSENDLNWNSYSRKIDAILKGAETNLFILIDTDLSCIDAILEAFKNDDIDIIHSYDPNDNINEGDIKSIINDESYNAALARLDALADKISSRNLIMARTMLPLKHGYL